jgi:SNF2 family DNA or RNA helicase
MFDANPTIAYAEGRLYLTVSPRYKIEATAIIGMKHYTDNTYWCPATWGAIKQARGVFGAALQLDDSITPWATEIKQRVEYIEYLKSLTEPPTEWVEQLAVLDNERITFTDEQKLDALIIALETGPGGGSLNGSVTGYGKTIVTLGAIKLLWIWGYNPFPVLTISKPIQRWTWKWEAERIFGPEFLYQVIYGTPKSRVKKIEQNAHFVFVSYKTATTHSRMAKLYDSESLTEKQKAPQDMNNRYRTIIGDELHKIKDRKAIQSRCAWALADDAAYRFGLTFTPQANDISDFWSEMRFISPLEYQSWKKTKERYFIEEFTWFELQGGAKQSKKHRLNPATEDEWHAIMAPHFLRRTERKSKVERIFNPPLYVELSSKQRTAYNSMQKEMMAVLDDEILVAPNPAVNTKRLLQIANGTPVFGREIVKGPDGLDKEITTITSLVMPSSKVDALLEYLEDRDDQVVVFMQDRLLLDLCHEVLDKKEISNVVIAGLGSGYTERMRQKGIALFQDKQVRVALVQYQTGAESLTLTAARRTLRLDGTYDYVANVQFPGRVDRFGQEADTVEFDTVIAFGTIEEGLHRDVFGKGEDATHNLRDRQWWVQNIGGTSD